MAKKKSKRLVIDACIARSSGLKTAVDPVACNCRDFLQKVLGICYRVVMTQPISEDWDKHQSLFALTWRASMTARKKLVPPPGTVLNYKLRNKIYKATRDANQRREMAKDFYLIEAALATDRIIVSRDDSARRLFSGITERVGDLKSLIWVNPVNKDEKAIEWLDGGARLDKKRQLKLNK